MSQAFEILSGAIDEAIEDAKSADKKLERHEIFFRQSRAVLRFLWEVIKMIEELAGMKADDKTITFTRNEWKHFIDELKMRGVDKIAQCVNNARYLDDLDIAKEQIKNGQVVHKTWEELEAMEA